MKRKQSEETIADRQQRLIDEFRLFDEWSERYQYLIDLGKRLPPMPATLRIQENRVAECNSDTFLAGQRRNGLLFLHAASDAPVLAGVLELLIQVYSGLAPEETLRHPPVLLDRIGLTQKLSPHRRMALFRIHNRLLDIAGDFLPVRSLAS